MGEGTLAHRLKAARSRAFVGRAAERGLFAQALDGDEAPFTLLWFHGPGGIGKSTLLRRLADDATTVGWHAVHLDARLLDPTPPAVRAAVGDLAAAAPGGGRTVLFLDTAEQLAPLDDWLREDFLPGLPARTVVVLASRHPPSPRWRADLGWAQEMRVRPLEALEPATATELLEARGVPAPRQPAVLELTRGHPLALALVADVLAQRAATVTDALTEADLGEVLPALLERFVDDVPDPLHRRALAVFGHARVTTEGLLRAVLGEEQAQGCYAWLRALSFAQTWTDGRLTGLIPHDLARDVLDSDLRLRDHAAWVQLHRAIRRHYVDLATSTTGAEQARAVADLLWFHRASPALAGYGSWDAVFSLWASRARDGDLPAILALVAQHEGPSSVQLHQAWWDRQPSAFWVIRDRPGAVHGFVVQLRLDGENGARLAAEVGDPFATAAVAYVTRTAPLRPAEHLRLVRSWIGRDGYYVPTPTHQAITGLLTRAWLAEPGLAVSMAYSADAAAWAPMFAHIDYGHAPDATVVVQGRPFGAFLHDWRVTSMPAWLELLEERELGTGAAGEAAAELAQRHVRGDGLAVLSREEFAAAVRDALRSLNRPAELARNPLLKARLVRDAGRPGGSSSPTDGVHALADLLRAQVTAMDGDPGQERFARVLRVTYVTPAATQEAAAARLTLPFSTYRRHLATALTRVTEALWRLELGGDP